MKVVITGPTRTPRETLIAAATRAGMDVMNTVSRRTSVLVTNLTDADPPTGKTRAGDSAAVPRIDETTFTELLATGTACLSWAGSTPRPRSCAPASARSAGAPP